MSVYLIRVKTITEYKDLDQEDQEYWSGISDDHINPKTGEYMFDIPAESEDDALDEFHAIHPISCLDDFVITAEELEE